METLFLYLFKANAALALFYLLYAVLLKKDTFLHVRRLFFLSAIVFSALYPFFTVDALSNAFAFEGALGRSQAAVFVGAPQAEIVPDAAAGVAAPTSAINPLPWLLGAFAAVTLFFALRFLWQLVAILRVRAKSRRQTLAGTVVYRPSGEAVPFSFFGWIFIRPENHSDSELARILLHEQIHARQWHSLDIVLAETLCIACWYNPFVWLLRREIGINLEYLADNGVLRHGIDSKEYQYHLLKLTYPKTAVQIVNNFNVSQLKQRIMMMNKTKSPVQKLAKYLLALPLALLMVTVNSCMNKDKNAQQTAEKTIDEIVVTAHTDPAPETAVPDEVFVVVEEQPEFPEGNAAMMKFLGDNIKYPLEAQQKNIQGRVFTNFVVEKDGSLTDVQVVRGADPLLDAEAVRVIRAMPNWTPGKQKGQNVRVRFMLPVVFRLQN